MIYEFLITLLLIGIGVVTFLYRKKIAELESNFENERAEIRRDAKKRSGAVQWGKTIEHFVPFMSDFPVAPEDCTFLVRLNAQYTL